MTSTFRACIRGGARTVGGSCVELERDGRRLVIDLGLPLDAADAARCPLPPIAGLRSPDESLEGVVISHAHPDHFGLLGSVRTAVCAYGPSDARRLLAVSSELLGSTTPPIWQALEDRVPLQLGPFRLTPWLVDHSAYESYALEVEAGGRRLFYSGDLRGHGRKPGLWRRMLESPPPAIDALLMEGTRLTRSESANTTEADVEAQIAALARETPGLLLVFYSAQNIDRLVSVFRAAKRAGRTLVLDLYGALVAEEVKRDTVPQSTWGGVEVFVPRGQRRRVIDSQRFDLIERFRGRRVFPEQLANRASEIVMTMRSSMTRELEQAECLAGAAAAWSMWSGYLGLRGGGRVETWLRDHDIPLAQIHASGHASRADLKALADAIDPARVVPIHTSAPDSYGELFSRVEVHALNEWWPV